jgi:phosphatidylethanolamine-binding protein (PEBP) family uncharacterized protein
MAFFVTSPLFVSGQIIPERFLARGEGISPPLAWRGAPDGTRSFALTVQDTDVDDCPVFWAMFDILGDHLREGAVDGPGVPATNDFGLAGYTPLDVPPGDSAHNFYFRLAALRVPSLGLSQGVPAREMWEAARRQAIEEVDLVGLVTGVDSAIG